MVDAEPSPSVTLTAQVIVRYTDTSHMTCIEVPCVVEYESEDQEEQLDVFTLDDLYSEITTAFQLGTEGVLSLPNVNLRPRRGWVWINIRNVESVEVVPPEGIEHD
jgi:hypothetical protein